MNFTTALEEKNFLKNKKGKLWAKFKDALSGLRQFLASGSPLKMMKMLFILP